MGVLVAAGGGGGLFSVLPGLEGPELRCCCCLSRGLWSDSFGFAEESLYCHSLPEKSGLPQFGGLGGVSRWNGPV